MEGVWPLSKVFIRDPEVFRRSAPIAQPARFI